MFKEFEESPRSGPNWKWTAIIAAVIVAVTLIF